MTTAADFKVWVVDDDDSIRWVLAKALSGAAMEVSDFDTPIDALEQLATNT